MKLFWSITAVYFFSLNFFSVCEDASPEITAALSVQQANACGDEDTCIPFCQCSCCGTSIYTPRLAEYTCRIEVNHTYTTYISPELRESFSDFWQPPRVS